MAALLPQFLQRRSDCPVDSLAGGVRFLICCFGEQPDVAPNPLLRNEQED